MPVKKINKPEIADNSKSKIFIGSSTEGKDIVYEIERILLERKWAKVYPWVGEFTMSNFFLGDLLEKFDEREYDYGVFILSPDDKVISRGKSKLSARDNVLFEAGIFIGRLGYKKVFFLRPEKIDLKIPSDILGLNVGSYNPEEKDIYQRCSPFCSQLYTTIKKLESTDEVNNKKSNKDKWVETLSCKTNINILNDAGDCTISETYTIASIGMQLYQKYVEIYSHTSQMDWSKLALRASNSKNQLLHIDDIDTVLMKKEFLINVPITEKITKFEYSYNWLGMFPSLKESYTIFLHADSSSFYLEYPEQWEIKYFKVINRDTQEPLPHVGKSEINKKKKTKVYSFEVDKEHKMKTMKIEWQK